MFGALGGFFLSVFNVSFLTKVSLIVAEFFTSGFSVLDVLCCSWTRFWVWMTLVRPMCLFL